MKTIIEKIYNQSSRIHDGNLASYIPELAKVDPELFGVAITDVQGKQVFHGAVEHAFTLQSASKPFIYTMALENLGAEKVMQHVGVEPTGEAFDSIIELEKSTHRPYNPMINSGAIAIANLIANHYKERSQEETKAELQGFLQEFTNRKLSVNSDVFHSEKGTAHRNRAIAYLLKNFKVIPFDIEEGLDLYFTQCSVSVNVQDLSVMAATLAAGGINPLSKNRVIQTDHATKALSLMMTCGMYDTAGEWAYSVGVPAKSGVSGAIFAVVPGVMGIAAFSPRINKNGHSLRGYEFIKNFVSELGLSIFKGQTKK